MTIDTAQTELTSVLDTMVDGVIMINGRGLIQRYNPACAKIFGYKKEDIIGQNVSMLMPAPYQAQHDDYIENYKTSRNPKIIGIGREVKGRRKDGSIFPMYLSVGEMPGTNNQAFVGIIRDLTTQADQREKFDRLQREHFHLSRVAAMDQMGAAIAHELNQPLTAIMNYLEAGTALMDQDRAGSADKIKSIMTQTIGQAKRAAGILARLRSFIETGDVEKNKHSINSIIQTAVSLTIPTYKNANITLEVNVPETLPPVLVSDVQIQQVLVNLIRNACEAMQSTDEKHLIINAQINNQGHIKVGIFDTGVGLTDAQLEKLYQPFSSNKEGGLGVGLSISQSIIANHNGRLWAEHNSPQGLCFYFTLPIASVIEPHV